MTVMIIEDFYIYVNLCTINNALGSLTKFKTASYSQLATLKVRQKNRVRQNLEIYSSGAKNKFNICESNNLPYFFFDFVCIASYNRLAIYIYISSSQKVYPVECGIKYSLAIHTTIIFDGLSAIIAQICGLTKACIKEAELLLWIQIVVRQLYLQLKEVLTTT